VTARAPVDDRHPHVLAVAAHGLPTSHRFGPTPLDAAHWKELLGAVRHQRLEGHLARAVADGALVVTGPQHEAAASAHQRAMATVLLCEARLVTLAPVLDDLGAPWRVLKGSALAHLDHHDPADRAYGDLDVLVTADVLPDAIGHLEAEGGRRAFPEPRPGFDQRFGKGAALHLPDGSEVDVHRTLALGPFGVRLDPDLLLAAEPARFRVGGRSMPALAQPWRLLHACYHAALGRHPARLSALRDVLQLLPDDGSLDLVDAATDTGGTAVVAVALTEAATTLGLATPHPLVSWARHHEPTRRDRRWLQAYCGPHASSRRRSLLVVESLHGVSDRVSYARAVVAPPRLRSRPTVHP